MDHPITIAYVIDDTTSAEFFSFFSQQPSASFAPAEQLLASQPWLWVFGGRDKKDELGVQLSRSASQTLCHCLSRRLGECLTMQL